MKRFTRHAVVQYQVVEQMAVVPTHLHQNLHAHGPTHRENFLQFFVFQQSNGIRGVVFNVQTFVATRGFSQRNKRPGNPSNKNETGL